MIVILEKGVSLKDKAAIVRYIEQHSGRLLVSELGEVTHIGLIDGVAQALADDIRDMPGVDSIQSEAPPYPQVSRDYRESDTVVDVGGVDIGGPAVVVIAGPCSVESAEQISILSEAVASDGARILRGGAFKPRTSPYSFQGLGEEGLYLLAAARERSGLPVVTEVVAQEDVELVGTYADMLQIGARNMQNFRLLSEVGAQPKPVLLKRGISSSIEELLLAAEYVASAGNTRVVLCERGIRTFENATRNTLDVSAVPVLKQKTHLPVIVDPSHAAGDRTLVPALAAAGLAAGADGIIVEVHHDPDNALSDGPQSLTLGGFTTMMSRLKAVADAVGRSL
ncbi:MAG TPA: 3-deoxy-7-phosphoheptulonate synthase [Acidimicrobiia bacterium]|nr:3-deoxy-7-phosphoheptulonate synthase [Acidimicrobiia bacterium]